LDTAVEGYNIKRGASSEGTDGFIEYTNKLEKFICGGHWNRKLGAAFKEHVHSGDGNFQPHHFTILA